MVTFSSYPADPRPRRAAEALVRSGMHVDLICETENTLPAREDVGTLTIFRVPIRHRRGGLLSYGYQYFIFTVISAAILAWRCVGHRYDLIYVHNMPDFLVVSALLPKALGAKVILDQHDPMPELMMTIFNLEQNSFVVRVVRRLEKWSVAAADLVITVNDACKRIFSARSCPPEKIKVVMNSPDGEIFPYRAARSYPVREPRSAGAFVIMYHGSLVKRNGLDLAIDALARLREDVPEAKLRIYGASTPYLEDLLESACSRGLGSAIQYLGSRRLEDLATEIQRCDVGVIPNHSNAFTRINTPTRIFEYLALGRPVVSPRTSGILDYFRPGSLFFFEPGDSSDLAKQLGHVYNDPEEAIAATECGQQVYLAHTWYKERQTLVDLVSGLLNHSER